MINDLDEVQYAYLLAPTFQFVNSAGKPITGGWMEVYIHGTRTKYYCCSDWDGTLHPFKIPLDSLGSNIVLASPALAYDVYVYNRFGSLIMSRYNVIPSTGGASGVIPVDITIESEDETVDVTVSGTTYNLSISGTIDKLNTVSADVEELKDIIATGIVQSDWEESDTEAPSYIKNKPDLSTYATTEDLETASGNLVDLIEEVSANIPEQVQSDWEESDSSSPAYIKNKPEESTLIAGDNIGIFASGSDYVISASGVDTSEFATHTEVNNVSGTIITTVNNVSSVLNNNIESVSGNIIETITTVSGDIIETVNNVSGDIINTVESVSGDLVEIIETATGNIPAQVQSDWIEDDTADPSYIKNKPNEKSLVAGNNISITVSGNDVIINSTASATPQVNSDWNATSGVAQILNKPDLSVYATNSDLQIVSAAIPNVSNFATKTEVNTVSGILENEIQAISGSIPEPFEGYTSPSGTSYIDNTNFTIEQSNSAIDYVTTYDWRARWQFPITTVPVDNTGFTPSTKEVKFEIPDTITGEIRLANNYEMTDYISGYFNNSSEVIFNIPQSWVGNLVYFYYNGDTSQYQISGYTKDGSPTTTEAVRKLAWEDDLMAVSAAIPDVSEFVTETELNSAIDVITATIPQAQVQSDWTEDNTTDPAYIKNKPEEVNLVAGDNISIVASGSDLIISASGSSPQPTVPNVEIVSPSGSIIVSATVDPQTNTKTFSIDVATVSGVEYGQFYATGVTGVANLAKTKGNLLVNNGRIQLHKGQSYHITVRGTYTQTTLANELSFFNYIEYISFRNIAVNVNKTISAGQYWEISYDLYNLSANTDYIVSFNNISNAVLSDVLVEVHSLAGGNGTGGSASGVEYTAGYGIQILNDVISVSGINPQVNADWNAVSGVSQVLNKPDEIEIVAGSGISIEESNNQLIISSTVTGGGGSGVNYQAGDHIDITNDTISVTGITELVAGTNITITMNSNSAVISSAGGQQVQSDWDEDNSSSPAYIKNKPSIPQDPEQSDWNETDPYSLAYIKNKPNISEAYTGASGIAIDNSVISLDEPLGIVAGSGINIVIEGDSAIICVSGVTGGGSSYNEGYGIDITNNTISVDTSIISPTSAVSAMISVATASIPSQVNSDWNANSGVAEILNKPTEANLLAGSGISFAASGSDVVINAEIPTVTLADLNTAGITDIQVVTAVPQSPVSSILYIVPET